MPCAPISSWIDEALNAFRGMNGWMSKHLYWGTALSPSESLSMPSPAQPLFTSHCKLQSHVASFGAFSEDSAGYRGGLEKPFNWTHPGEFLCQHFWVWVGFCHRFCLDTSDSASDWGNSPKQTAWCRGGVSGTIMKCCSWLAGKIWSIINENKKKACEEKRKKGDQTTQQQRQTNSPKRSVPSNPEELSCVSSPSHHTERRHTSQGSQSWPQSRGRDVFFIPYKSQKWEAFFLSFAKRSTYKWVWGREWVSLVSLVGRFRSQFCILHFLFVENLFLIICYWFI